MTDEMDILERVEALGCTDGYCRVLGPAKGMHTNGGCSCFARSDYKKIEVAYKEFILPMADEIRALRAMIRRLERQWKATQAQRDRLLAKEDGHDA